ncbi:response regulator [Candidatus Hydrogenedentota bacterium]
MKQDKNTSEGRLKKEIEDAHRPIDHVEKKPEERAKPDNEAERYAREAKTFMALAQSFIGQNPRDTFRILHWDIAEGLYRKSEEGFSAILFLIDSDTRRVFMPSTREISISADTWHEYMTIVRHMPVSEYGYIEKVLMSREPYICNDINKDPLFEEHCEALVERGIQSRTVVPLYFAGKAIGVLIFSSGKTDAFAVKDLEYFENVAGVMAMGLAQGLEREKVLRHLQEVESLASLARSFITRDPRDTLRVLKDEIGQGLFKHYDGVQVTFFPYDAERDAILYPPTAPAKTRPSEWNILLKKGGAAPEKAIKYIRHVLHSRESYNCADVLSDPLFDGIRKGLKKRGCRSRLIVPVVHSDDILGLITCSNSRVRAFTREDVLFIEQVASVASIGIAQALMEEELRASQEFVQAVQRTSRDGMVVIDRDCNILWHHELIDPSRDSVVGQKCFKVFEDREDRCPHCVHPNIFKDSRTRDYETTVTTHSGEKRNLWVVATPMLDEAGDIVAILETSRDITERKNAEEERQKLETQIQHAQKLESLGVLAGGIAHDFNNLLMGILGNADLALQNLSSVSPIRGNVKDIEKASIRAADLCKQMLAYSGRGQFVIEALDLSELTEEMSHMLEVSISKKAVLKYDFAGELPPIEADATQMRQIVINLITNASEAIGDKSGVISIRTGVIDCDKAYLSETYLDEDLAEGPYTYFEVSDTGSGMDEETKAKLFDPFFTTKFTGRGLGLSAVLGIVRGHKGAIKVYSETGKGTTFKVLFPARMDQTARSILAEKERNETGWRGNGTVLLVDDDETVRDVGKMMLESMGLTALTAADGREAVALFGERAEDIDCVVLDLTMPHMDGEEAFRELRRIRSDIRVVLSSGYNEQDVTQRFVGKGVAGFVQKPYRSEDLREKLQALLS